MNNEIARYSEETFESIKHVDEYGYEFWYARSYNPYLNIRNGEISRNSLKKLKQPAKTATWLWMNVLLRSTKHRPCRTVVLS